MFEAASGGAGGPLLLAIVVGFALSFLLRLWPDRAPQAAGPEAFPRVYYPTRQSRQRQGRGLFFILAFVVILPIWNMIVYAKAPATVIVFGVIFVAFVPLILWITIRTLTARFVVDAETVSVVNAFGRKVVRKADITGVRIKSGFYTAINGSTLPWLGQKGFVTISSAGRKRPLFIPAGIQVDGAFDDWVSGLATLDAKTGAVSGLSVRDAPVDPDEAMGRGGIPYVTVVLLLIMGAAFLGELQFSTDLGSSGGTVSTLAAIGLGAINRLLVFQHGQWFRVITAIFLHHNVLHLLMNGLVLLFAGIYLEKRLGRVWYLALFLFAGICGSFMSMAFNAHISSVGASGAIMGLLAAIFVISFRQPVGAPRTRAQFASLRLLVPALIPTASSHHIDIGAHLGGALGGAALAYLLLSRWPKAAPSPRFRRLAWGILIVAALFLPVGSMGGLAMAYCERGELASSPTEALAYFDHAIAIDGQLPDAHVARGVILMAQADYDAAVTDFQVSVDRNPAWAYNAILIHLARAHRGRNDTDEMAANAARVDGSKWPGPVLAMFMGKVPPEALFAAAKTGDQKTQADQTCEANFYLGEYELLHSAPDQARDHLRTASMTCPHDFIEFKLANPELKRLRQ